MRVIHARFVARNRTVERYAPHAAGPLPARYTSFWKRRMADGSLDGTTADQRYSKNVNARNHILVRIVPRKNVSWQ